MKKVIATLAVCFSSVVGAQAVTDNGFSYNHIEFGYSSYTIKGSINGTAWEVNPRGPSVTAMMMVSDNVFVIGGFEAISSNTFTAGGTAYSMNTDFSVTALGAGYRFGTSTDSDFYVAVTSNSGSSTITAGGVSYTAETKSTPVYLGVRTRLSPGLEADLRGGFSKGNAAYQAALSADLSDSLSIVGGYYKPEGDVSAFTIGLRVKF
jgi:hypothetical protein